MDSKEITGLMEAYSQIYQVDELSDKSIIEDVRKFELGFTKKFGPGFGSGNVGVNASVGGGVGNNRVNVKGSVERGEFSGQGDRIKQGVDAAINNFNTGSNDDTSTSTIKRGVQGEFSGGIENRPDNSKPDRRSPFASAARKSSVPPNLRGVATRTPTPNRRSQNPEVNEESFDIFDTVLEFLQAEGYAETLEEAEWMMANVIDEEAIGIILGEEQLDELSNKTVSNALNARIAATGAASDRAYKHRNPEAMRAAETAAGKEASMRSAVAKRRARMNKEEYMDEAQAARENPEKYEREQQKKTAPVRGERTPMPPRGDKRREDFEKWYAANVR